MPQTPRVRQNKAQLDLSLDYCLGVRCISMSLSLVPIILPPLSLIKHNLSFSLGLNAISSRKPSLISSYSVNNHSLSVHPPWLRHLTGPRTSRSGHCSEPQGVSQPHCDSRASLSQGLCHSPFPSPLVSLLRLYNYLSHTQHSKKG